MTRFLDRLGGVFSALPRPAVCDAWMADDRRFGDEWPALADDAVLGRWPDELETDAATSLAITLGDHAAWDDLASAPAVVQGIADRARLQPLDREILRHLPHLQHVCHRPRLHLRVDEERVPVSRARRTPVRAVADLVSHPGDWEHRTLRSIQPSRVLARLIEDEWNLYENRVAARLVDHLLAYVARRLAELNKVERSLRAHKENVDEGKTSFWRARRIMTLWAGALDSKIEDDLRATRQQLEHARRDLQALLDAPLYQQVPRRVSVALSLRPTNILVNDPHYRKVAALWRAWVNLGHRRQETQEQRAARRQLEARAWDRFVLHLVVRAFSSLSWHAARTREGWTLSRDGHSTVDLTCDEHGVIVLRAAEGAALRLLPLCASFAEEDAPGLLTQLRSWDRLGALVAVYVHPPVERADKGVGAGGAQLPLEGLDPDRASGWVVAERAALLGCSPWGIDSEERMSRLLNGWIHRTTVPRYPRAREGARPADSADDLGMAPLRRHPPCSVAGSHPGRARRRGHMGSREGGCLRGTAARSEGHAASRQPRAARGDQDVPPMDRPGRQPSRPPGDLPGLRRRGPSRGSTRQGSRRLRRNMVGPLQRMRE